MAAKIRVHELAKELGLTNKETLDLCVTLGIAVKTHSSSIEDPQADRVRRKAEREGLIREEQPPEPEKPKKATAKKATAKAKAAEPEAPAKPAAEETAPAAPPAEAPAAPAAPASPPVAAPPPRRVVTSSGSAAPPRPPARPAEAPTPPPAPPRAAPPAAAPPAPRPAPAAPAAPAASAPAPAPEPAPAEPAPARPSGASLLLEGLTGGCPLLLVQPAVAVRIVLLDQFPLLAAEWAAAKPSTAARRLGLAHGPCKQDHHTRETSREGSSKGPTHGVSPGKSQVCKSQVASRKQLQVQVEHVE